MNTFGKGKGGGAESAAETAGAPKNAFSKGNKGKDGGAESAAETAEEPKNAPSKGKGRARLRRRRS